MTASPNFCGRRIRCPRASGQFLRGARVVFVSVQIAQFGSLGRKSMMPYSWLGCVWSLGPFCDHARSVDSSSELTSISPSVFPFAQRQVVPPGGFTREAFCERLKPSLERHAHGLPVLGHLGKAICRPTLAWDRGYTRLFRKLHNWHVVLRLAP